MRDCGIEPMGVASLDPSYTIGYTIGILESRLAGEQQTLARPLRALIERPPVSCGEQQSVRDAIEAMRAGGAEAVLVVDAAGRPSGIFTASDVLAVAARGLDDSPVAGVMTRSPFSLPAHALAYEAALAMIAQRIRHVLVTDEGQVIGIVSERDLFALQRLGLGEITTEIRLAVSVDVLVGIAAEIRRLAQLLVDQGVAPEQLTLFVSVLNDRLCQRIVEIERKNHAWERISWCWLAFGSEGRFEQTFSTDQDNGIVFAAHGEETADSVRDRLLPFARAVNEALDACGFPLCKGNIMASNPKLCLSLDEWKEKMHGWIVTPEPQALLDASICFDFRPLHGDSTLADALREWLLPRTRANPAFLRHMADNALQSGPPLGRLRDFITSDAPGAPHTIDLKMHGSRIFVDAARIYALAHGVAQTNTGARLRAARAGTGMSEIETSAIIGAFYVIQRLRLALQAGLDGGDDGHDGRGIANRIDPAALNELERRTLKEAFRQARLLQNRLELDYQVR